MPASAEESHLPLTEHCHHYEHISEVPWDIQKYWHQRCSIFSMYDDGIYMTDDAWFGVTPEPVAIRVASDLSQNTSPSRTTLIDLFAGAGGNTIAFALAGRWERIIAIERDASVLACAQHNAYIYGVFDKITWVNDDCFSYLSNNTAINPSETVIFASPPWGGPGYSTDEIFNLATMQPYSLKQIHDACKTMETALFLPRTSDLRQLAKRAPPGKKIDVVQYCMEGASKGLVAYFPANDTS
jgi:trimethylguanosine synthase